MREGSVDTPIVESAGLIILPRARCLSGECTASNNRAGSFVRMRGLHETITLQAPHFFPPRRKATAVATAGRTRTG